MLEALTHPGPGVKRGIVNDVVWVVNPLVVGVRKPVEVLAMANFRLSAVNKVIQKHTGKGRMPPALYSLSGKFGLGNMVLAGIFRSYHNQSPAVGSAAPPCRPTKARIPVLFASLEAGQRLM